MCSLQAFDHIVENESVVDAPDEESRVCEGEYVEGQGGKPVHGGVLVIEEAVVPQVAVTANRIDLVFFLVLLDQQKISHLTPVPIQCV